VTYRTIQHQDKKKNLCYDTVGGEAILIPNPGPKTKLGANPNPGPYPYAEPLYDPLWYCNVCGGMGGIGGMGGVIGNMKGRGRPPECEVHTHGLR